MTFKKQTKIKLATSEPIMVLKQQPPCMGPISVELQAVLETEATFQSGNTS